MKQLLGIALAFVASLAAAQNINIGTKNTTYKDTGVAEFKNATLCFREGTGTDKACISAQIMSGDQTITIPAVTGTLATLDGSEVLTNKTINGSQLVANSVSLGTVAQIATARFLGRTSASTGNIEELTATQATAMLNAMTGDAGSGGLKGLVPAQATGDATKTLSGAGTWITAAGTPGGSTTQIQYNSSGAFAGSSNLVWDNANVVAGIGLSSPSSGWRLQLDKSTTWPADVTAGHILMTDAVHPLNRFVLANDGNTGNGIISVDTSDHSALKVLRLQPDRGTTTIGGTNTTSQDVLSVDGNTNGLVNLNMRNESAGNGASARLTLQNDGSQANGLLIYKVGSGVSSGSLCVFATSCGNAAVIDNPNGDIQIGNATSGKAIVFATNTTERVRINDSGLTVASLTSGRIPITGASGLIGDSANLTMVTTGAANSRVSLALSANGDVSYIAQNTSTGTAAYGGVFAINSANYVGMQKLSTGYTTAGLLVAGLNLYTSDAGATLFGNGGSADFIFSRGGTATTDEKFRIGSTGPLAMGATAIPAGGTAGTGYRLSSTSNFGIFFGSGAPTLSAAQGSLYLRSDGTTTNDRAYINTNGSTTWTALTTGS